MVEIEVFPGFIYRTSPELVQGYKKWIKDNQRKSENERTFAIGGEISVSVTITSVGLIVIVENNLLHNEFDLTDYSSW